jgi:uncharacterized RDD family membrane protein YckC
MTDTSESPNVPTVDAAEDTSGGAGPQPTASVGNEASAKADIGKRAVAMIIDALIALVVGLVPIAGGIAATAYWLVRDGMEFDFMDRRSIGKKIMKLRPVTLDGRPMDIATSVKRNWMFALGGVVQFFSMTIIGVVIAVPLGLAALLVGVIEVVLVFTDTDGRRMGDKLADTRVVETDS